MPCSKACSRTRPPTAGTSSATGPGNSVTGAPSPWARPSTQRASGGSCSSRVRALHPRLRAVWLDRRLRSRLNAQHHRCRAAPLSLRPAAADRILESRAARQRVGACLRLARSAASRAAALRGRVRCGGARQHRGQARPARVLGRRPRADGSAVLELNGWEVHAEEAAAVLVFVDLAAGKLDETQLALWL